MMILPISLKYTYRLVFIYDIYIYISVIGNYKSFLKSKAYHYRLRLFHTDNFQDTRETFIIVIRETNVM